jgi:hypothetical protein
VKRLLALFAAVTVSAALAAPAGAAPTYPVPYTFLAGIAAAMTSSGSPPPGANNWACRPSADHPYPVVLVHGLFANMTDNWQTISPLLADNGYCVFALTYGTEPGETEFGGLIAMEQSAAQLGSFVTQVLAATGASQVDIVGHSEGATMPDYYVKFLGGDRFVHEYVGISDVMQGTTADGLGTLAAMYPGSAEEFTGSWCQSCSEFLVGSPFVTKLDSGGGPTVADVHYTLIVTQFDELVTPYTNGLVDAPNVTDIVVQSQCPLDFSDHIAIVADPVAAADVLNALDPGHPRAVPCVPVLPVVG